MKRFLLVFIMLLVIPATGQEHAPTAAQCQADAAVWGDPAVMTEFRNAETAFLTNGTPDRTVTNKLGYEEIIARMTELLDCEKVDPPRTAKYGDVASFYHEVLSGRWYNFITRHNLWNQFQLEDNQGKR